MTHKYTSRLLILYLAVVRLGLDGSGPGGVTSGLGQSGGEAGAGSVDADSGDKRVFFTWL